MLSKTAACHQKYRDFYNYKFEEDDNFWAGWKSLLAKINPAQLENKLLEAKLLYYSRKIDPVKLEDYLQWLQIQGSEWTVPVTSQNDADTREKVAAFGKDGSHDENMTPDGTGDDDKKPNLEKQTIESNCKQSDLLHEKCEQPETLLDMNQSVANSVSEHKQSDLLNENCNQSEALLDIDQSVTGSTVSASTIHCGLSEKCNSDIGDLSLEQLAGLIEQNIAIPGLQNLNIDPLNTTPSVSLMNRCKKPWEK